MGVVPYQTAGQRAGAAELRATAESIIDRLGNGAGWFVGATARSRQASPEQRERLLALAAEIERIDGIPWLFPEDHPDVMEQAVGTSAV
jgi:hypothetical protein